MQAEPAEHSNDAPGGFDRLLGFELMEVSATAASARVSVRDELKQPYGLLHGGVFASIAESLASWATALGAGEGRLAVGLANSTSFLRPITEGTVHASAVRLHAGRTTWVWDVQFRDDADRLCAVTRMTIAVRERPLSGS
jgi:1,4-dihydroxy-2-naphthoyl-CoA hydrolase